MTSDASEETEDFELGERRSPSWLLGGVTEQLDPEMLKLAGRVRQWAALGFIVTTAVPAIFAAELGFRLPFYRYYAAVDICVLALAGLCGRLLWRRTWSARQLVRLNVLCLVLECLAILLEVWVYGSANAPILGVAALWVLMYRLTLDTRTGLWALGAILFGHWGILGLELLGAIPAHPGLEASSAQALTLGRQVSALAPFTLMLVAGFVLAHWTKLRLVDRERTLRVLRRALASGFPGEIGPETGRLLGGVFAVGARLGRGGMGEVYEATDTSSKQRVAVKMLHPYLVTQARSLRRFAREAAILRGLGSPHIVRVLSVQQDEGRPFMVLELLTGETLKQRIQCVGGLQTAEMARLAWQLAAALDLAHHQGVVHRDLNPANVFLCDSVDGFTVKVLDFGISKVESDENAGAMTQDGALLGTPGFMAPEQAEGRSQEVTPRTDVYAMGLVLFAALAGRAPFADASLNGPLRRVRDEAPSIARARPELDPRVDEVLKRATHRSPEARYATAGELALAFVSALGLAATSPQAM